MHRWDDGETVEFNLTQGEWMRLFRANGFEIEDLIEVRPAEGATSTYRNETETAWARRWPMEQIWKVAQGGVSQPPSPPLLLASTSPQRRAILEQLATALRRRRARLRRGRQAGR